MSARNQRCNTIGLRLTYIELVHVAIEVDGFGDHRDLESFKKDREKQKHALKRGG